MRKGLRLPLEHLHPFLTPFPHPGQVLNYTEIFGNTHPVELEVGFGKGAFLVESALQSPERNYLGIEIDRALQLYVANRVAKRQLVNVKLIHGNAQQLLASHISSASLTSIHIYFPDPWWKKRHQKRRVFSSSFATDCARVLRPHGQLFLATDVAEYFQIMLGIMAPLHEFSTIRAGRTEALPEVGAARTNFEKKAYLQGRPVWNAEFERKP